MKRIVMASALAVALLGWPAHGAAQVVPTTLAFTTVDSVAIDGSYFHVTGVLEGGSAPVTRQLMYGSSPDIALGCQRMAMTAMARPGYYRFNLEWVSSATAYLSRCRLTVANP